MLQQKATFAASGFDLAVVGVGPPESGAKFCDKAAFPAENLYVDPSREVYDALGCYHGLARTFFNKATPNAIVARGMDQFKASVQNYEMIAPKNSTDALQQGGLFIFRDGEVLYSRKDEGTADHAPMDEVLAACCA